MRETIFLVVLKGVAIETIHSPGIFKVSQNGDRWAESWGLLSYRIAPPHPLPLWPPAQTAFAQSANMGNEPVKLTCVPSIERTPFLTSHAVFFMRTPGNNSCLATVWTKLEFSRAIGLRLSCGHSELYIWQVSFMPLAAVVLWVPPVTLQQATDVEKCSFNIMTSSAVVFLSSYLPLPHF